MYFTKRVSLLKLYYKEHYLLAILQCAIILNQLRSYGYAIRNFNLGNIIDIVVTCYRINSLSVHCFVLYVISNFNLIN